MDRKYKKTIPLLLTLVRILFTPFIILFGFLDYMIIVLSLVLLAAISDFFDGFLARKWNSTSLKGAKMDAIADKVFATGLIISLLSQFNIFIYILTLEVLIGFINLAIYKKTSRVESLFIGKFKTCFLFLVIVLSIFSNVIFDLNNIVYSLSYVVINLQVLSIFFYINNYFIKEKNKPSLEKNSVHNEIMNSKIYEEEFNDDLYESNTSSIEEILENTIVIDNLSNLEEKLINEEFNNI